MYILNNPLTSIRQCRDLVPLLDSILLELNTTTLGQISIDIYIGEDYRSYIYWQAGSTPKNKKIKDILTKEIKSNLIPSDLYIHDFALFNLDFKLFMYSPELNRYIKDNPSEFFRYQTIVDKIKKIREHKRTSGLFFNFEAIETQESSISTALRDKFKILEC